MGLAVVAAGDDGTGAVGIAAAVGAALVVFVAAVVADQIDFERIVDEVAIAVVDHRLDAIHTRAYY